MTTFTSSTLEIELTAGVWTDITQYIAYTVNPVVIKQGRPTEYDDVSAGSLTCTLWNDDGRFMPDNQGGAFYPNFVEGKRIRFKLTKAGTTYTRFLGWIQSIIPQFPGLSTTGSTTDITVTDSLGLLAQRVMRSNWTEVALWRGRTDGLPCDAFEATGTTSSYIAILTNYSADVGAVQGSYAYSAANPNISFSTDPAMSLGGVMSSQASTIGTSNSVLLPVQATPKIIQFFMKTPQALYPTGGGLPNDITAASLVASGFAGLGQLVISGNGASANGLWVFDGTLATNLGIMANLPFNQWVAITIASNAGTPSHSDWSIYTDMNNPGSVATVSNVNIDIRNTAYLQFPGDINNFGSQSWGGIITLRGTNVVTPIDGVTAATGRTVADRITSLMNSTNLLPYTYTTVGTNSTVAACTGSWSGRTALDVAQEIARTALGIAWARGRDSEILWMYSDVVRPSTPVSIIDLDGDCVGVPKLARGADSRPTRVQVTSPAKTTVLVVDTAAETALGGAQRLKSTTTINASNTDITALANLYLQGSAALRISQVAVDLLSPATDHTAELFSESTTQGGLYPTQRIRLLTATSHFGIPTRDVHVQGWTESYGINAQTITMDTTPALVVVTVGPETFAGTNGSGFPGASFTSRVDINGTGSTLIQSNRGRITTAAAATAGCYAVMNTTSSDLEVTALFQLQSTGSRAAIIVKSTSIDGNGYVVRVGTSGTAELLRNTVQVATWPETVTSGTDYQVRFRAAGGYLNFRLWPAAGNEPGTWDVAYVDSSPLVGTQSGIGAYADGSTATARAVDWDNLTAQTPR